MVQQDILRKIRGLLAKADLERNPSEEEAMSAMRLAKKLMAEHSIAMAEVKSFDPDKMEEDWKYTGKVGHYQKSNYRRWHWYIAKAVETVTNTMAVKDRLNKHEVAVYFYGEIQDCSVAVELMPIFLGTADRLAKQAVHGARPSQEFYRSFCVGFALRLYERAREEFETEELEEEQQESFALVLVTKNNWLTKFHKQQGFTTGKMGGKRTVSGIAYAMGQQAADGVDLGAKKRLKG